jgi:hypothetical protein
MRAPLPTSTLEPPLVSRRVSTTETSVMGPIFMTGAGDLFSRPQPVTAKPVRPLPLKGAAGSPRRRGSAETQGSGAGRLSP